MQLEEIKAIKACQNGQLESFTLLYDAYIRKIYDFVYFKTYHKETAEDLTSLIFLKAFEKIKNFDVQKGSFSAWLYAIANNTIIDYYRGKKNEANIDDIWDLSAEDDISLDLENKNQLEKIRAYIRKLPAKQRNIIILRLWQNLSYKEIAQITSFTETNCKMIFSRAIRQLRQEMPESAFILFLLFGLLN